MRLVRSRFAAPFLALAFALGIFFVVQPRSAVRPPLASVNPAAAVCGNNRCELGEKAVTRITIPNAETANQYGDQVTMVSFGRVVSPAGDLDGDGVIDLAVGGIQAGGTTGNRGSVWFVHLNRNGSVKSMEFRGTSNQSVYLNEPLAFGSAFATLGKLTTNGPVQYAYNDIGYDGNAGVFVGDSNSSVGVTDFVASAIANIGDINGDGMPDLAIGRQGDGSGPTTPYGVGLVTIVATHGSNGSVQDGTTLHVIPSQGDVFPEAVPGGQTGLFNFGKSIAPLGDLNGDGKTEIAVGEGWIENTGRIWILSLNSDGTVASKQVITPGTSFSAGNDSTEGFATALTNIGDWNGDGIPDLAATSRRFYSDDSGSGQDNPLWILYLNRDGTVKGTKVYHASDLGVFAKYAPGYQSNGLSLASIPDIDGDGKQELVLGDPSNFDCNGSNTYLGSQGAALLILSKQLDACPKDCNWCVPSVSVNLGAGPQINQPQQGDTSKCSNGTCDAGELNPMPIPGATYSQSMFLGSIGSSVTDLGDLAGDGTPTIAIAGKQVAFNSSVLQHESEIQIISLHPNGSQKSVRRLFEGTGGLVTGDEDAKKFGTVAALGDVNNDGVPDLATSPVNEQYYPGSNESKSIWILFLNKNGTVKSFKKIAKGVAGFNDTVSGFFAASMVGTGDMDGDGVPDLAVSDSRPLPGTGFSEPADGAVRILLLNRDGTVKSTITLRGSSFFGPGDAAASFGFPLASLGDIYGDGRTYLAVGGAGKNWVSLFLNKDGTVNTFKTLSGYNQFGFGTAFANMGDQNGDGKPELAVLDWPISQNLTLPSGTPNLTYDTIAQDGTPQYIAFTSTTNFLNQGSNQLLGWPFMGSMKDMDNDGRKELLLPDQGKTFCANPYSGSWGLLWLWFSGSQYGGCANDCNAVNYCFYSPPNSSSARSSVSSSSSSSSSAVPLSSSSASSIVVLSSSSQHSSSSSSVSVPASSSSSARHSSSSSSSSVLASSSSSRSSSVQSSSVASSSSSQSSSSAPSSSGSSSSSVVVASSSSSTALQSFCCTGGICEEGAQCSRVYPSLFDCMSACQEVDAASSSVFTIVYGSSSSVPSTSIYIPRSSSSAARVFPPVSSAYSSTDYLFVLESSSTPTSAPARSAVSSSVRVSVPSPIAGTHSVAGASSRSSAANANSSLSIAASAEGTADLSGLQLAQNDRCGDGVATGAEECDQGILNSDTLANRCRTDCTLFRCGDGVLDAGEQCDDGNTNGGDGCNHLCQKELPGIPSPSVLGARQETNGVHPAPAVVTVPQPQYVAQVFTQPMIYQTTLQQSGSLGQSGPETVIVMVSGAAAGFAWLRRKKARG
jgi:cysteine-rich repeat protein